mgnify:CR=1 FL=1
MAIAQSYPLGTPKTNDLLIGTSIPAANTNGKPMTGNFSVGDILALGNAPNILTAEILVTDAQLRTLGTAPVEILPAVAGYSYQMLGLSTVKKNTGGAGADYDWGTQSAVFSWRTSIVTAEHRVEIPYTSLPNGGPGIVGNIHVGTLIAGNFRVNAALRLSLTSSTNPIITGNPGATWKINVTYRLIETS